MNYRRSIAAVGFAGVLALAACGTEDQVTQPAARPADASQDAAAAFQHYYDITHPQQLQPAREPSGDAVVEVPVVVKPARGRPATRMSMSRQSSRRASLRATRTSTSRS